MYKLYFLKLEQIYILSTYFILSLIIYNKNAVNHAVCTFENYVDTFEYIICRYLRIVTVIQITGG